MAIVVKDKYQLFQNKEKILYIFWMGTKVNRD